MCKCVKSRHFYESFSFEYKFEAESDVLTSSEFPKSSDFPYLGFSVCVEGETMHVPAESLHCYGEYQILTMGIRKLSGVVNAV